MTQNHSAASAYNNATQTVSSLRAVVMLYDGMIQSVGKAKTAAEEGRIEERFNATQKACRILLGLQANLDFDRGGEMAVMLDRFYHTIFRDLQAINLRNSPDLCDDVIAALKEVRRSWGDLAEQDDRGELVIAQAPRPKSQDTTPKEEGAAVPERSGLELSV